MIVQILLNLSVVFAEIRPPKPEKIKTVDVFGSAFGFGAYVKALIGFKAFYFFGSFRFRSVPVYM